MHSVETERTRFVVQLERMFDLPLLWWTAMLMTTIASEYSPRTGAGRALALAISLYSVGVFGYITATLASVLVGKNSERPRG